MAIEDEIPESVEGDFNAIVSILSERHRYDHGYGIIETRIDAFHNGGNVDWLKCADGSEYHLRCANGSYEQVPPGTRGKILFARFVRKTQPLLLSSDKDRERELRANYNFGRE